MNNNNYPNPETNILIDDDTPIFPDWHNPMNLQSFLNEPEFDLFGSFDSSWNCNLTGENLLLSYDYEIFH